MAAAPRTDETRISGIALLISLTTPESEVMGLDPVKFIARKAESAGRMRI